jgi:uncharacterized membrane protein YidH (DUF202 family)
MRRALFSLGLIALLLGAARLTLGVPDVAQVLTFFGGGVPTQVASESVMVMLAWLLVLVTVLGLGGAATRFGRRSQLLRKSSVRAAILLAVSLVLLIVGAVHRSLPPAALCCGSNASDISQAIHLAQ